MRLKSVRRLKEVHGKMAKSVSDWHPTGRWNAIMRGYVEAGMWEDGVGVYVQMYRGGVFPDHFTFPSLLKACSMLQIHFNIHLHIIAYGFQANLFVGNALVSMYAKCGLPHVARHVFDKMPHRNVVSWNSVLAGYTRNEEGVKALQLFGKMQDEEAVDTITIATVLSACGSIRALKKGQELHAYSIKTFLHSDVLVGNALLDMYGKCGIVGFACRVFHTLHQRNRVSWNTMITIYIQNGNANKALQVFGAMEEYPDVVTISSILPACGLMGCLPYGKEIHAYIITTGLDTDLVVHNALLHMYAKCGSLQVARKVFEKMPHRDVVSWNAMVAGFAQNGQYEESLKVFGEMNQVAMKPNSVTIASVVPALACLGSVEPGKAIHNYAIKCGYESDLFAMNSLMDMYIKCGSMEDARRLFDYMFQRDVVSWNVIIAGYTLTEHYAYDYSKKNVNLNMNMYLMRLEGVIPDSVTIVNVVSGCGQAGVLERGKGAHSYLIINGFESHISVGNALVDMYAKCGSVEAAHHVFAQMPQTNVISWNTMIGGYGMHGLGEAALSLFYEMQQQSQGLGLKPDHITFIAILSACSHTGLDNEGLQIFDSMSQHYHMAPTVEHYACVVDLLGRAGRLDDAYSLIVKMPVQVEADASVWGALLGGCRIHCNLKLGKCVAEHLFHLEPTNTGNYLLFANMCAASGEWERSVEIRTIMKNKGLKKTPGCSWIEVKNRVHVFLVGDQSHPQSKEIYSTLEILSKQMEGAGYMADSNFVMLNVEEEEKDHTLYAHSEKLAIVFGLINTFCGTPIRISKNLRMCSDCHNATKFISRIVCREIIVRDSHRFHHFKDGLCSCWNYW